MSADENAPVVQMASPVEQYLAGVREALADLPAHEVAEILDDVRAHLADLAGDLDGDADYAALVARLGTPTAYAEELRAAAGYPAPPAAVEPARQRLGAARLALVAMVASSLCLASGVLGSEPVVVLFGLLLTTLALPLLTHDGPAVPTVAALPVVRRFLGSRPAAGTPARTVADFVAALQPAWWVARAFAASVLSLAVFGTRSVEAALLLTVLATPVSVWVGHRTRRDRRLLWAVVPLNALAAALILMLLPGGAFGSPDPVSYSSPSLPGLWQDSERQILDIRPVDSAGNPLSGVYLFDQDGVPIDVSGGQECSAYDRTSRPTGAPRADAPYPRGTTQWDSRTGDCVLVPPVPLVAAVPSATPTPTPTVTPTPTPVASATPPAPSPPSGPPAPPSVVPPPPTPR